MSNSGSELRDDNGNIKYPYTVCLVSISGVTCKAKSGYIKLSFQAPTTFIVSISIIAVTANLYSHCEELSGRIGNMSYVAIALTSSTGVFEDLEDVGTSIRTLLLLVWRRDRNHYHTLNLVRYSSATRNLLWINLILTFFCQNTSIFEVWSKPSCTLMIRHLTNTLCESHWDPWPSRATNSAPANRSPLPSSQLSSKPQRRFCS